jgi:hypothetical protein
MDARLVKVLLLVCTTASLGATYRTPNFVVKAPTESIAKQVGIAAEDYRVKLAEEWLGERMNQWYRPCHVTVKVGQLGAGGATTFNFDRGHVFGWRMRIQGTLERILDSVLPHEISHTVFACHFRRPLPRWADEGAATLVEHESERRRQTLMLRQVFKTGHRIGLRRLLSMKEYPKGMQSVLTLYAEGYALAEYLVQQGGKARYLAFLEDAHRHGWDRALQRHYKIKGVDALEQGWEEWVIAGSPQLPRQDGVKLADATQQRGSLSSAVLTIRSQSPDAVANFPARADRALVPGGRWERSAASPHEPPLLPRSPTNGANVSAGRLRALNDGWIPLSNLQSSRTGELPKILQQPVGSNADGRFDQTASPFQSSPPRGAVPSQHALENPTVPTTLPRVEERILPLARERSVSSGRTMGWSDFPQRRFDDEPARIGRAPAKPLSPP